MISLYVPKAAAAAASTRVQSVAPITKAIISGDSQTGRRNIAFLNGLYKPVANVPTWSVLMKTCYVYLLSKNQHANVIGSVYLWQAFRSFNFEQLLLISKY